MRWKGGKMRIQNVMATSIKIDTVSATQSLRSMNTALKASTSAWKAEEVQAKSVGNYLKASQARYEGLGRSIDQAKEKIKLIQERQKALDLTTEDGRNSYNRYARQLGITVKQLSSMIAQQKRARSSLSYESSGLAELQKHYRESISLNKSYVDRLESEGKTYLANKARVSGYRNSIANLTKQYEAQSKELNRIASESGKTSSAYKVQQTRVNETATAINKAKSAVSGLESENKKLNPSIWDKIKSKISGVNEKAVETHKTLKEVFMGSALGNAVSNAASNLGSSLKSAYEEGMQLNLGLAKINGRFKSMGMNNREIKALDKQIGELKANTDLAGDSASDLQAHMLNWSTIGNKGAMQMAKTVAGIGDSSKLSGQQIAQLSASLMRVGSTGKVTYSSLSRITKAAPSFMETLAKGAGMSQSKLRDLLKTGNVTQKQFQTWMANASKFANESFKGYSQTQAGALKSMTVAKQKLEQQFTKPIFDAKTSGLQALKDIMTSKEVMSGANQLGKAISDTIGYLDKHKADITGVTKDIVSLGVSIGKETWKDASGIIMDIGKSFGLISGNAKKSKDPLHVLKLSMDGLAKNKTAIQWISKAIIAMAAAKGISHVGMGLLGVANNGYKAYKNIKALRNGFKGLQDIKDLKGPEHAFAHLGQTIGKLAPKVKGLFNQKGGAGKLSGLLQSARSAGGFKNLTTAGKIGTSAAGVGVTVDTATSIVKAIKDKAGSRKQYEDVGTAAGKGIGGAIGLWFGGPAGAAVGASIGAKVGKWGGDAVKSFTNGWKSKKPPKRFWSLENLGWSTKDTFTKIGKWGQGVGKKFGQGLAKGKSFAKKNAKELALTAVSPMLGIPALLYKNNPKFRKWANGVGKSIKKGLGSAKKNVNNFNKAVSKNVGNFTKSASKKYRQFTSSVSKTFKKHWNQMYKHSSKGTKQIMRSIEKFGKNYVKINKKYGDETRKNFGSFSKRLKKNHGDLFKTIGQTTKTQLNIEKKRWTANWKNIKSFAGGVWKGLTKNAGDMYKSLNAKTHGGLGKVFNGFKSFGKSIGDFWKNLWKDVKDTFDNAIKGLKDTASNVGKFFSGKLKVGNIHLAEGTDWRKKYGYSAIVNDGSDSPETNNREALIDTDGTLKLFPNIRNLKWWMLPGQHVVNAHDLATMFGRGVHLASGTFDFNLLRNYRIRDEKTPDLLNKLVKINSRRLKLSLKTYDEDKERHEKTKRRREKKDRESKKTSRTHTRKDMEYLDSSFFTGGKSTGKIVSVSKSWLKKYLESELPKKTRKRTRTTRRRSSSSRSSSSSSRRSTTTTRRERTTVSASVRGLGSVRSLAAAIKSVSGKHTARVSVSASNTKSVKSLKSALSKVKSKRIKVSVSGTKSVKSLSSALNGISKKGTLKGISSASSRLKTLSKRTKSTRSSLKGLSSANSKASRTNKTLANQLSKTSSKVKSLYKAAKKNKFGKEIKSQAEEAVKSLKGKGNFAKTFESMTKKFGKDLKSMSKDSTKEFKSMWSNIEKTSKSGENSTHKSFNTFSSSYKRGWKSLESGVSTNFDHFWTTMRKTAGKGLNKVIDVLNSGIGKIDTVIGNFGGNKNAVHKVGGVHYATGTGYFAGRRPITRPTWTVLNDGNDSPETQNREGIYNKQTGELTVVNGRNVPKLLDSRHEVFNASEMRDLGFTHYASGTGYLKRLYDQAKHYWNNPTKTGDSLFGKITGLVGAINSLANGMLKSGQKQGAEWWSQLWKMVEDKVEDDGDATLTGLVKAMAKNGHGKIYQWGATGPKEFDCSGLVMYTLKKDFGIDYPHFSGNQYSVSQHISRSEAKPGDLVFWGRNGGIHVGAYAGHNQYYSAYGPNGTHGIGMMPLSSVVGYGKPLFARVRGLKQKDDKHEEVKANTKLQKLIKNQVGKGFWKTISKIADKFGDAGGAGNVKLTGDLTQKSLQLAKALKRADPKATAKGIAALISNAIAESTLNAGVTNGSGATGLWQFLGSRRVGLENYARRHGGSYHNAGIQIDYALHGDSSRALFKELLEGSRSPYSMAYQFSRQWEIGGNDAGHAAHADSLYKLLKDHGYANGGVISSPQLAMVGEGNGPETIIPWDITKRARAYRLMDRTLKHFKQQDDPTSQGEDSKILLEILKVMTSIEKKIDSEITETRKLGEQPINVSGDFNVDGRKFARYIRTYLREFDRQTVVRGRYNLSDR